MESVEVWMWVIAGLIFTGILLTGAFKFLGHYTKNADIKQASESFISITKMADRVCAAGIGSSEQKDFVFPYIIANLSQSGTEDFTDEICMTLTEEKRPRCYVFEYCNVSMTPRNIDLTEKYNFFKLIQKSISGANIATFRVKIEKIDYRNVTITFEQKVAET